MKEKEVQFILSFTGNRADELTDAFSGVFWDGGIDQHLEQDFLEHYGLGCDDCEFTALNHVTINTDHATEEKPEKNCEKKNGAKFIFSFSGIHAKKVAAAFVAYFWDGGFDQYLEEAFLSDYGMGCDDFEFISLTHVNVNTDHATD